MAHVFYGLRDQDQLDHGVDEVMERHFDGIAFDQLPSVVRVYEYRNKQPDPAGIGARVLETALEILDEDYGDFENPGQHAADPIMNRAACHFLRTVIGRYRLHQCDPTGNSEWVNVRDWAAERQSQGPTQGPNVHRPQAAQRETGNPAEGGAENWRRP